MDKSYVITVMINGTNTPAIVDSNAHYSVITTGLLDILKLTCNNVKFIREQILFGKQNTETLGKIRRLEFILKLTLLHHDVYIMDCKLPLLLFGQDWMNKYDIRHNILRTHLILKYQLGKIYIPIHQQEESNPKLIEQNEEKPIDRIMKYFESNHESWTSSESDDNSPTKEVEELLIDITKMDEEFKEEMDSPICEDILELDALAFQQNFDQLSQTSSVMCSENMNIDFSTKQNKEEILTSDPFQQLNPELIIKICELLTIGDLNSLARVNKLLRKYVLLIKDDRKQGISQEPYYFDIGREFLNADQLYRYIHLAPELTGEEATRRLRNTPKVFYTQTDYARFFQNKRDWSMGNQSIEEISQEKDYNIRPNKQIKCYICKKKGYTMKSCNFEPVFREHEQYCKQYNVHVWKSWKPPEEWKLKPKGTHF